MPGPDELGIHLGAKETVLDWEQLRRDLDRLDAQGFQLEKHTQGFRFVCQLRDGPVEGIGNTEAEAVRIGLSKVK